MSQIAITNEHQQQQNLLEKAKTAYTNKLSDEYHIIRPIYTLESAQHLLRKLKIIDNDNSLVKTDSSPVTIVELGCGTGLLTDVMVQALDGTGVRYIATDPLKSMENTFQKNIQHKVEFVSCKAETMPFPDNSVTAVVAGASFHWFATQEAYKQIYRVLEPNGMVGYITNVPSETDPNRPEWTKKCYAPYEHDYKWRKELLASGLFEDYREDFSLKYFQDIRLEDCVKMISSFAVVAAGGEKHRQEFEANLRNVLKRHFLDKNIEFPGVEHTTEMYTFRSVKKA